jgi:hypothetical protein
MTPVDDTRMKPAMRHPVATASGIKVTRDHHKRQGVQAG